ncbi:MAG: phosphopantetheine-binding protein [Anaeromyxobacter sp.]
MVLGALPLTPNGKIDRKALPAPEAPGRRDAPAPDEAHLSPVQRRVAALWREVLHADRVGLHDNFFDVGGHSLLLVKLHAALRAEFGEALKLVDLFRWTTVAAQAERLSPPEPGDGGAGPNDGALRRAQARAKRQMRG